MRSKLLRMAWLALLLSCLIAEMYSQSLPDYYSDNPYTFKKSWVDDFNKKESRWAFADWTFDHNLCEFNQSAGTFSDGILNLAIKKKQEGNLGNALEKPYWGAEYGTDQPTLYGRYLVRMKPSVPAGVVTSFFLSYIDWNEDYTEAQEWYEIDIEFAGKSNEVQFTLHWMDLQGRHSSSKSVDLDFDASADFHQWVIEWTPTYIKFYVDDKLLHSFDDKTLVNEQAHAQNIQMNNWVSDSEEWVGAFNDSKLPVVGQYDYVAYYELVNTTTSIIESSPYTISTTQNDSVKQIAITGMDLNDIQVRIFDINGKLLKEEMTNNGIINSLTNFSNGVYLIELRKSDWVGTYKVIL